MSDSFWNDQITKVVGGIFNRRQGPAPVRPINKSIRTRTKSFVLSDPGDPYGMNTASCSAHPGNWAQCRASHPAPLGALQAPDKFYSFVCLWPEKDFTLGRATVGPHTLGLDARFPFGGWEYSAKDYSIRFEILVDDGKSPNLYQWVKVARLTEAPDYKPVLVHGLCPMVVNNILGKGSTDYLTAWTSDAGREIEHSKDEVLRALVLCIRHTKDIGENGWREIHIHEPARISPSMINTESVTKVTERAQNDLDKSRAMKMQLKYTSEEGQSWKADELEQCDLQTILKSENVLRKLAEDKYPIGLALYATSKQRIDIEEMNILRSFEVPPMTKMTVTISVFRQEMLLNCPAMEHVYSKEGKLVLKRLVSGRWRAVSTRFIKSDLEETALQRDVLL